MVECMVVSGVDPMVDPMVGSGNVDPTVGPMVELGLISWLVLWCDWRLIQWLVFYDGIWG